jgi:hypothetical protein
MSASRNRVVMVAVVAAVALLSVGATAYAAEQGQLAGASTAAPSTAVPRTTAASTPSAPAAEPTPTPSPTVTAVPAPVPTQPAAEPEGDTADGTYDDGNVVEVRTPNPDAIPTTVAEREYFYGLVTQCMAEAGFDWRAVVLQTDGTFSGVEFTHVGDIDPALQAGFTLALDGDTGGGDYYHWADAGCWGYAVHVTGNDGNN